MVEMISLESSVVLFRQSVELANAATWHENGRDYVAASNLLQLVATEYFASTRPCISASERRLEMHLCYHIARNDSKCWAARRDQRKWRRMPHGIRQFIFEPTMWVFQFGAAV